MSASQGVVPCPAECEICFNGWVFEAHAVGECVAGDGPCRSTDPDGVIRHPGCKASEA